MKTKKEREREKSKHLTEDSLETSFIPMLETDQDLRLKDSTADATMCFQSSEGTGEVHHSGTKTGIVCVCLEYSSGRTGKQPGKQKNTE